MHPKSSVSDASIQHSEESSQHIWLAGLGALAKAQSQGTKAFEALIADGLAFQRKTHQAAQDKIAEASAQLSHLAKDFGPPTSGRVDRLEHLFEDRVARALRHLGMPSLADLEALAGRVAQLEAQLPQAGKAAKAPGAVKKAVPTKAKAKAKARPAAKAKAQPAAKAKAQPAAKAKVRPAAKRPRPTAR
jgi:poly(hydroxyalkanoate) granule-associated protein